MDDENVMLCRWLKLGLSKNPYLTVSGMMLLIVASAGSISVL
jgi:hypothetical protein